MRVRIGEMSRQLFTELREQADPRVLGHGEIFDEYPFASEELRGFYERFQRGEKLNSHWVYDSDIEPFTSTTNNLPLP